MRTFLQRGLRQIRIGIGAAHEEIENIDGGEGYKAEAHVIADTVAVHQGRPPDQSDRIKEQYPQVTEQTSPEHDFADPIEGYVFDRHYHNKQLQEGDAGPRHLLYHHQITEKDSDRRYSPHRQTHIRQEDPDQEKKQAEIPDQFPEFSAEDHGKTAVVNIGLQHPQYESRKSHELVKPDPGSFLGNPEPDRPAVKNHIFYSVVIYLIISSLVSPGSRSQASIPCMTRFSSGGSCI